MSAFRWGRALRACLFDGGVMRRFSFIPRPMARPRLPCGTGMGVVSPIGIRMYATRRTMDRLQRRGPISWTSLAVLLVAGGAAVLFVQKVRKEKEKAAEKERTRSLGKAALGGPFSLVDHNGQKKMDKDFRGQWLLLYFGFTFCPDICPDELDKMTEVVTRLDQTPGLPKLQPIFISVDPTRDTPAAIKEYLKDFHPRMLGLTGTEEEVKAVCKAYRVYYSAGPTENDSDYLVDHTIIIYLVDPKGHFVDYYGQNRNAEQITTAIATEMIKYKRNR